MLCRNGASPCNGTGGTPRGGSPGGGADDAGDADRPFTLLCKV